MEDLKLDGMNNYSPNISIFRDIATVIDTDELVNMYRIYHWKVLDNQHIEIKIYDPEIPKIKYCAVCEFYGDGIIYFRNEISGTICIMDINKFYYSQSVCRNEFKRILREKYWIKL